MIEIVINARFLTQPMTGVQRYAYELVRAFDQMMLEGEIDPTIYSIVLAAPPDLKNDPEFKYVKLKKVGRLKGNLWEQISLPLYSRNKLLFNPCNTGPVLGGRHQIVTIHDASVFTYPQAYTFLFRLKYKLIINIMCRMAATIITVSKFSRNEISYYCGRSPDKIVVIPEGSDHILRYNGDDFIFERFKIGQRPYIFAASSQSVHKNHGIILKAVDLLGEVNFDVVIAGGTYSSIFNKKKNNYPLFFKQVGYVSNEELRSLYGHATCFIFPSLYEGFGLPPLEAMACGCPVIVSDVASMPEVCGNGALYFNPNDPVDLSIIIKRLISDHSLQNELKNKGLDRVKGFLWKASARKIWQVITKESNDFRK